MKLLTLLALLPLALATPAFAQNEKDSPPEEKAIAANDRAFEKAYGAADYEALAGFFTDDAEYTSEDGRTISGRAGIEQAFKEALTTRKGGTIQIGMDSLRTLAPGVVVEKGGTLTTARNGETDNSQFTAVLVQKDGKWKIANLVESPAEASAHDQLSQLGWMIGKWKESAKEDGVDIDSEFTWARGGNFITRNVTVKRGADVVLEGWQIIGWDASDATLRSWTFDTDGGFSEGTWTRQGDRWLLRETGVAADGSRTGADNTFSKVSDDKFTYESGNRTLNGEPQPSISRIEIVRAKGAQ